MTRLTVRGLSLSYGSIEVLSGVDLSLSAGSCGVVRGENGSGKSSLVDVLGGIHLLQGGHASGTVELAHRDVSFLTPHQRLELGLLTIPDDGALFPGLTVRENIELRGFGDAYRRGPELACRYIPTLAGRLEAPLRELSGGERRLVTLSRLLCLPQTFKAVILDEPFRELDDHHRDLAARLLTALPTQLDLSVLVTSHLSDLSSLGFDKAFTLRDGLVSRGSRPVSRSAI